MKKKLIEIIIYIFLFLGLLLLIGSGCNPKLCPAYDSNVRAKNQKKLSKVDKWNSDFCKVKPKKKGF